MAANSEKGPSEDLDGELSNSEREELRERVRSYMEDYAIDFEQLA